MKRKIKFLVSSLAVVLMSLFVIVGCNDDDDDTTPDNDFNYGSLMDSRDGKVYKTIVIGNQVWMAENLRYLPFVVGLDKHSETTPYYNVYGYDGTDTDAAKATENYQHYGVLYNWPAAMGGADPSDSNPSGVKGVCPSGWHLPSVAEWTELTDYLGNNIGGKLKATGTDFWLAPNTAATNETGFAGLPGGRKGVGVFNYIGRYGFWWSTSLYDTGVCDEFTDFPWQFYLVYNSNGLGKLYEFNEIGVSVRCIRD